MSTLVVHAHPLAHSYSAALRDAVTETLTETGASFELARLARNETPRLDGVTHLIAVYPTWWGGIPAVLLEWLQQLLGPIVDEGSTQSSPLRSVNKITVVTTHGSSQLVNHLQGQAGKQTWTRVVLPQCAKDASFEWISMYKIDRSSDADRQAFLNRVRNHVTSVAVPA